LNRKSLQTEWMELRIEKQFSGIIESTKKGRRFLFAL